MSRTCQNDAFQCGQSVRLNNLSITLWIELLINIFNCTYTCGYVGADAALNMKQCR